MIGQVIAFSDSPGFAKRVGHIAIELFRTDEQHHLRSEVGNPLGDAGAEDAELAKGRIRDQWILVSGEALEDGRNLRPTTGQSKETGDEDQRCHLALAGAQGDIDLSDFLAFLTPRHSLADTQRVIRAQFRPILTVDDLAKMGVDFIVENGPQFLGFRFKDLLQQPGAFLHRIHPALGSGGVLFLVGDCFNQSGEPINGFFLGLQVTPQSAEFRVERLLFEK